MISFNSKISKKVLSYFLLNPQAEMYLNEMARKFEVDRGNLARKLAEWEKEGIIKKRQRGNLSLYKTQKTPKGQFESLQTNEKYPLLQEMKKIAQKSFGLEEELRKALGKIEGISRAIIFGSYAKDKLEMESDIDLLLVGSHNFLETQKEIVRLQKKIDREINVIDMTEKEFAKEKKKELIKNILSQKHIRII
jgi:predicted nucleotidyltransferase